ncbi:MAG: hypothetical protein H6R08_947 [Proteobacteria bacterium]|nr:hypothetical protein [Pseudomonadota bacterium]
MSKRPKGVLAEFRLRMIERKCRLVSEQTGNDLFIWATVIGLLIFVSQLPRYVLSKLTGSPMSIDILALGCEAGSGFADNFGNFDRNRPPLSVKTHAVWWIGVELPGGVKGKTTSLV